MFSPFTSLHRRPLVEGQFAFQLPRVGMKAGVAGVPGRLTSGQEPAFERGA